MIDAHISEKDWTQTVLDALRVQGWFAYHTFDSRRSEPGFPDVVAVHPARKQILWVELKTAKGKLSAAQEAWGKALRDTGADYRVWRPADWDEVIATARGH